MTTINTFEDLIRIMDENPEWVEAMRQRLLTRELLEMPQTLAQFIESTNRRFDEVDRKFQGIDRNIKGIRDDLGVLKGAHVENVARRQYFAIAYDMGMRDARLLSDNKVFRLAVDMRNANTISRKEFISFRRADMVIEAVDSQAQQCYMAVEVSYTLNGRDSTRAIRNARFLAQRTGRPARAVVAGLEIDHHIRDLVDSGDLYWHQIPRDDLEAA